MDKSIQSLESKEEALVLPSNNVQKDEELVLPSNNVQNAQLMQQIGKLKEIIISSLKKDKQQQKQQSQTQQKGVKIVRQIRKNRITNYQQGDNPESQQVLVSKVSRLQQHQEEILKKREDLYWNIRKDWKMKIAGRGKEREDNYEDNQPGNTSGQGQSSIIDKHISFFKNSRVDSEEEALPSAQFKNHHQRQFKQTQSAGEFNFKKVNIIPAIEQTRKNFRSYITKNKKIMDDNSKTRYPSSTASKGQQSQLGSYFGKDTNLKSEKDQPVGVLKQINKLAPLLPDQKKKQTIIQMGNLLFQIFGHQPQAQLNFNIKKYKNCIVYSCLPQSTKALIYNYNGNMYYGNIGLDQNGKFEKNGSGIEIVKGRHYYSGGFINGKKNGRGKIYYQNGDQYDGQWHQGQIFGFGRYLQKKSDKMFEGFWKKGQYCGQKYANELSPLQFQ